MSEWRRTMVRPFGPPNFAEACLAVAVAFLLILAGIMFNDRILTDKNPQGGHNSNAFLERLPTPPEETAP